MKVIVHKKNLQRALGFVERVTSKNTALPILSNLLLKTENGRLRLLATNLEVGISAAIGAKVEQPGQIAVPGRILADFVRAAQGEVISLTTEQKTLSVDAGAYKTSLLCFDAAEYPLIPKIDGPATYTIPSTELGRMIASVIDSVAVSESRPELAGALLSFQDEASVMAATDSFRLVECRIPMRNKQKTSVIVPRGALTELLRILTGVDGDITVKVADNQIAFSHEDVEVVSRLIDGKYPDYHKVIPEKFLAKALVRKDELENAAKIAALFSSSISDIKLDGLNGRIHVNAKNASKGEVQADIEANTKGDAFDIALNYHYFLDGLKIIPTEKVVIEFTGKGSPFVLRPNNDDKNLVYLIMPLRN